MKVNCQLKGSTFCDGQIILRRIMSGNMDMQPSDLILVRDHSCKQDKNCVQVRYKHGGINAKIGNVNKENAPMIASCMDQGGTATITSTTLYGNVDEGQNVGMYFWVNTVSR